MNGGLQSDAGGNLLNQLLPLADRILSTIDELQFADAKMIVAEAEKKLTDAKTNSVGADENFLNDLYLVGARFRFLSSYIDTWEEIVQQHFAKSWSSLQDALDTLRAIKRLSEMDVQFFEAQLVNLEPAYPYNVFFSIGAVASRIECSICGKDIDSMECVHRRGQLYAGETAYGIIREFKELDHVSMVTNPEDKRCVVVIEDTSDQFKLVRFLGKLIGDGDLLVSEFDHVAFTKRRERNPSYKKLGRNEPCYCGSGKKFKACCIDQSHIEREYAEVRARKPAGSATAMQLEPTH